MHIRIDVGPAFDGTVADLNPVAVGHAVKSAMAAYGLSGGHIVLSAFAEDGVSLHGDYAAENAALTVTFVTEIVEVRVVDQLEQNRIGFRRLTWKEQQNLAAAAGGTR